MKHTQGKKDKIDELQDSIIGLGLIVDKLIKERNELLEALKNLTFTATKLWDEVKNIKDGRYFKVTHPMIEEAKQAIAKAEEEHHVKR